MPRYVRNSILYWFVGIAIIMALWQISSLALDKNDLILPDPLSVVSLTIANRVQLFSLAKVTGVESILGVLVSVIIASTITLIYGVNRRLENFLYPFLVMVKASPAVVFVPIFIIIFGSTNIIPRILSAAIISFFPIIIAGIDGARNTPEKYLLIGRNYGTSDFRSFRTICAAYSIAGLLSGMKTAAPLCVVGAIVGEYVGGGLPAGLGTYIFSNYGTTHIIAVFAGALMATILGLFIFSAFFLLERIITNEMLYLQK